MSSPGDESAAWAKEPAMSRRDATRIEEASVRRIGEAVPAGHHVNHWAGEGRDGIRTVEQGGALGQARRRL